MPAVALFNPTSCKECLNISKSIMNFSSYFHRHKHSSLVPVVESCVTNPEFFHDLGFCQQFFYRVIGGYRTNFIEYSLNKTVSEQNEVGIFYCDIEIGDTAFNKSIDVYHAIPFPVCWLSEPVPDRFRD